MKGKKESLVPSDFKIQLLSRPGNNPLGLYHHRVFKNRRRGQKKKLECFGEAMREQGIGQQSSGP